MSRSSLRRQICRFRESRVGLAYIWTVAICTLIFTPIIVWPLNSAFLMLEESLDYAFIGADLFAIQVMNITTGYILFFVVVAVVFKSLIAAKAENANVY